MKKNTFSQKLLQYYLPITLTLFMLFTEKRSVTVEDGGYDRLFGFPLPYISNNFGCTGCYDVYLFALLIDLLAYFIVIFLIFNWVEQFGLKLKFHLIPLIIGLLISAIWISWFYLVTSDSRFKLLNDINYKTTSRQIIFTLFPDAR